VCSSDLPAADTIAFTEGGAESMRITSAGDVGIGTSSPAGRLAVSGGTTIANLTDWNSKANSVFSLANPAVRFGIGYDSSDNVLLQGFDTTNLAKNLNLQVYGGNVGIGTSSPTQKFEVSGSSTTGARVFGGSGAGFLEVANSTVQTRLQAGASDSFIGNLSNHPLLFITNNTERMRIDSSGNLLVGTTSADAKLYVLSTGAGVVKFRGGASGSDNCQIKLAGTQTGDLFLVGTNCSTNGTGANFEIYDLVASASRFNINSSGIVTMNAYGAGAATFSASGVISSVSDETWKIKDGAPTNPDAMLQKLEAGYWFYNEEKAPVFGKERQLGFYAQNVHEAIGEEAAPTPEEGKPWGYYDRSVLAVAVMSLKNALSTIEELKQRIATLENK
jgi:hypothetical protein